MSDARDVGGWRHIHMSMSVKGALAKSDKQLLHDLGGCMTFQGRTLTTAKQIRDVLEYAKFSGHELIPMCKQSECPEFDCKTGCPGHPGKAEEKPVEKCAP
jgi:hypothetical protein